MHACGVVLHKYFVYAYDSARKQSVRMYVQKEGICDGMHDNKSKHAYVHIIYMYDILELLYLSCLKKSKTKNF